MAEKIGGGGGRIYSLELAEKIGDIMDKVKFKFDIITKNNGKTMKKINIYTFNDEAEVICILGFDEEKKEIVILKGETAGRWILKDRFLNKKTLKHISIEISGHKKFFEQLPVSLTGSRCWASEIYS